MRKASSPRKGPQMATIANPVKPKSAQQQLLDSVGKLVDNAAESMSDRQFKKAEKGFNKIVDRAIAAHSRRRETA